VTSQVCVALLTNQEYNVFTALSQVFVQDKFAKVTVSSVSNHRLSLVGVAGISLVYAIVHVAAGNVAV
jgi:hypothetical protein